MEKRAYSFEYCFESRTEGIAIGLGTALGSDGGPLEAIDEVRALAARGELDAFVDASIRRFTELAHGTHHEYARIVDALSTADLERIPEALVLSAAAVTFHDPDSLMGWARIERAISDMRARTDDAPDPWQRVRAAGIELAAYRVLRRSGEAATAASRLEALLDSLPAGTLLGSAEAIHVLVVQVINAYVQDGRLADAIRALSRTLEDPDPRRQLHVQSLASMAHALSGDIVSARRQLARMAEQFPDLEEHRGYNSVGWRLATALVAVEDDDPKRGTEVLDALDARLPGTDHWASILAVRGRVLQLAQRAGEAADTMQELVSQNRGRRASVFAVELLRAALADLLLAATQPERARVLLEAGRGTPPTALALARLALRDDPAAAWRRVTELLASVELSPRLNAEALLVQAIAAARLGLPEQASDLMGRLTASIGRRGHLSVLLLAPRAELLALLPPEETEIIDWVSALPADHEGGIAARVVLTAAETRVLQALLDHVTVRELAAHLFLSQNTIKTHLRSIYRKLGANDRATAISIATRRGLLR